MIDFKRTIGQINSIQGERFGDKSIYSVTYYFCSNYVRLPNFSKEKYSH